MRGLENRGNACYLNTLVQCLHSCPRAVGALALLAARRGGGASDLCRALLDVFVQLAAPAQPGPGSVARLCAQLAAPARAHGLDLRAQNDVTEVLFVLLDALFARRASPPDGGASPAARHWLSAAADYNPAHEIFFGQSISQIACGHCAAIHHRYEKFSCLLAAPAPTLARSLDALFPRSERARGWVCDRCRRADARSERTVRIWSCPRTLVLSLKRGGGKLAAAVSAESMPLRVDVSPWSMLRGPTVYELAAFACHQGDRRDGGHYYAVCRRRPGAADWCVKNDRTIERLLPEDDPAAFARHRAAAYVLFYEVVF